MALLDSWTATYTATAGPTATFTFPRAVPANRLVVLAVGRGGGANSISNAQNVGGNVWAIERVGVHTTNSLNIAMLTLYTANPINAGATFTLTYNTTSNRWAVVCGVFDDVSPLNKTVMASALSTAQPAVACGPTPALNVPRALVLTAAASTSAGFPLVNSANKLVAQTVTAEGSADRGVALFFKNEGGYVHTGSFLVPSSVISVSVTAAVQTPELAAGYLPVMTIDGEVPGKLSNWTGSAEVAINSIALST